MSTRSDGEGIVTIAVDASFDDVVLPPTDLGEITALNDLFQRAGAPGTRRRPVLIGVDGEETVLPKEVYHVLVDVVSALSKGQAISLFPQNTRLTTREAADFLGVSRPTLIRLLEDGKISYEQPSRHRYVMLTDLITYRASRRHARRETLAEMTENVGLGTPEADESPEAVRAAIKAVRAQRRDIAGR